MRNRTSNTLIGLFGLLILAGLGYLAVRSLVTAHPEIATAGIALVTALAIPALTNYFQRRQQIEADQREQKAIVYEQFLNTYFDHMLDAIIESRSKQQVSSPVSEDVLRKTHALTKKLILWGSDDVVREYLAYRQQVLGHSPGKPRELPYVLTGLEVILYEIRKDLGYANKNLGERELLAMFINDLTEPSTEIRE